MIALIAQAIGYGFAAGTSPGPLLSFLVGTTLTYGWRLGLMVVLAPLLTDLPIILVMVFLLEQLPDLLLNIIQIAGGVFVLWLAWGAWREVRQGVAVIAEDAVAAGMTSRGVLWRAITMNYLSPGPYIFWGSVTGPLLRDALDQSALHVVGFLLAFYGTFMLILVIWVIAFDRLRHVDPRVTQGVLTVTVSVLAMLGIGLMMQGLGLI